MLQKSKKLIKTLKFWNEENDDQSMTDIDFNCSDIISPYQKMTSKVFPLVLPILTNLWVFFKIPKIQKSYNIRAIFLRVLWWSKRLKLSLKSQKKRRSFFSNFFQMLKKAWKKRVFCDFKDHFNLLDHQTTFKNISRILYDFCIFGILKRTHKFGKIGKTSGNTLVFSDP